MCRIFSRNITNTYINIILINKLSRIMKLTLNTTIMVLYAENVEFKTYLTKINPMIFCQFLQEICTDLETIWRFNLFFKIYTEGLKTFTDILIILLWIQCFSGYSAEQWEIGNIGNIAFIFRYFVKYKIRIYLMNYSFAFDFKLLIKNCGI